jgi:hypothetical protein
LEVNVEESKSCHKNKGKHNRKITDETSEVIVMFTCLVMLYIKHPVVLINCLLKYFSLVHVCSFHKC